MPHSHIPFYVLAQTVYAYCPVKMDSRKLALHHAHLKSGGDLKSVVVGQAREFVHKMVAVFEKQVATLHPTLQGYLARKKHPPRRTLQ